MAKIIRNGAFTSSVCEPGLSTRSSYSAGMPCEDWQSCVCGIPRPSSKPLRDQSGSELMQKPSARTLPETNSNAERPVRGMFGRPGRGARKSRSHAQVKAKKVSCMPDFARYASRRAAGFRLHQSEAVVGNQLRLHATMPRSLCQHWATMPATPCRVPSSSQSGLRIRTADS